MDRGEADMDKHNESHDMNDDHGPSCGGADDGGKNDATGDVDMTNRTDEPSTKSAPQEERPFPRIQIKSPSKLAQEFHEKQKQSDANDAAAAASAASINENNRTNNNKSSVDMNTTPLYDEPAEDRSSYSSKEAPSSHSFASENHETPTQSNTDTVSSATAAASATASTGAAAVAVTTESTDNCEN